MSSSEPRQGRSRRAAVLAGAAVAVAAIALGGCTVRPLYATGPTGLSTGATTVTDLASIGIAAARSRESLEVRNHLIFLLAGGRGEPSQPRYRLDLGVTRQVLGVATRVRDINARDVDVSAAILVMTSNYRLTDAQTGDLITSGRRQAQASFDRSRQEFAALRAQRDAEDRAARELAEALRLALAQDLERVPAR